MLLAFPARAGGLGAAARSPKADTPLQGGSDAAGLSGVRRIGLFGGSFDPVHNAHLALARHALDELALDELCWVPAGQPWQKPRAMTPAVHREAMLRLAIGNDARCRLERCELQREGPSYTLDTVHELQAAQAGAQWFLVIGQDQLAGLHTWRGFEELLRRVTLAVAARPGVPPTGDARVLAAPRRELQMPAMALSSTDIRARAAAGLDISALVPQAVAQYIHQHHLYRGTTGS
jgi:nicotinate-nucleotide adenylyltransferase